MFSVSVCSARCKIHMTVGFRVVQVASKYICCTNLTRTTSNSKLQVPFRSGSSKWQLACVSAHGKEKVCEKKSFVPTFRDKHFFVPFLCISSRYYCTSSWHAEQNWQKKWTNLGTSLSIFQKDEINDLVKLFPRHLEVPFPNLQPFQSTRNRLNHETCLFKSHGTYLILSTFSPRLYIISRWYCFNVGPYLGKWSNLTNIFQLGWNTN